MTFQTPQNNDDNRDNNSPEGLPDEICSIWQERGYSNFFVAKSLQFNP